MTAAATLRGAVFRCPVCGAEVTALAPGAGSFRPRCCNRDMVRLARHVPFYRCLVCGSQIAVLRTGGGRFEPRCCNRPMIRISSNSAG